MDKHWKHYKGNVQKMKSDLKGAGPDTVRLMDEFRAKHAQSQRWKQVTEL